MVIFIKLKHFMVSLLFQGGEGEYIVLNNTMRKYACY